MFAFGKIAAFALLPPGSVMLLMVAGLFLSLFKKSDKARKWSAGFFLIGALLLFFCAINPLSDFFIIPLEDAHKALGPVESLQKTDFEGCSAIVVLGSGAIGFSPEEGQGSALNPHSVKRVSYALRLSKRLGLPIVFSGGTALEPLGQENEAHAAKRFLIQAGMKEEMVTIEEKSADTWQNAEYTAALLKAGGCAPKVILVTSAFHMPRSVSSFKKNGVEVVPAPTDYLVPRGKAKTWFDWMPSALGLEKVSLAGHEYLGEFEYLFKKAKPAQSK